MTTQFATASYQEVIDLHTESDRVSVLGIHTPVTDAPYTFLQGFFDAFQKYHYDGCSLSLVPAARLPADPSQVSYEAGEQPIDPRDLLNPILWHGAHGESLGSVLNQFYSGLGSNSDIDRVFSDSVDMSSVNQNQIGNDVIWQSLYYRALTDNTWKKAHPQQGFRVSGLRPLVYSLGTNIQYVNSSSADYNPQIPLRTAIPQNPDVQTVSGPFSAGEIGITNNQSSQALGASPAQGMQVTTTNPLAVGISSDRSGVQFFSERLHRLGWLDTRSRVMDSNDGVSVTVTGSSIPDRLALNNLYEQVENTEKINYLPRLFMGICLLPPAYKTEQYFRLVLNHRFSFRKFRGLSTRGDLIGRFGPGNAPGYTNLN